MTDPSDNCELHGDLSFDGWVNYVFEHPILDPAWWWRDPESGFNPYWESEDKHPARTLAYLTTLFKNLAFLIDRFSRPQIDQGLYFLFDASCSNHMFPLLDGKIAWEDRRACFDAIIPLYEKLMAPVYGNDLGAMQDGSESREKRKIACYLFWEVVPFCGGMDRDRERINDALLYVFEEVLKLNSEACLESVLHGLGHWHDHVPDRTEPIVRRFLARTDISADLREYAEYALIGRIR